MNVFLPIAFIVIGMGSGFSIQSGDGSWYSSLAKPFFNPPSWIFGPVWTLLYILLGLTFSHLIQKENRQSINLFVAQSILNFSWSMIFFQMQRVDLALINIFAMWTLNIIIVFINRNDKKVFLLMFPYMVWISFAMILNLSIYIMND